MCCVRTEALALLRHNHLFSFLLDPVDVSSLNVGGEGADWNFIGGTGLPTLASDLWAANIGIRSLGNRKPVQKAYLLRDQKGSNQFNNIFVSVLPY